MDLKIQHSFENHEQQLSAENALKLENEAFLRAFQNGNHEGILSSYEDSIRTLKLVLQQTKPSLVAKPYL